MRALREFFDRPDLDKGGSLETNEKSEGFFNEWFLYDFVLQGGCTVLEDFIATNPLNLKDAEMKIYQDLLDNTYGIFEVLEIDLGKNIKVIDLQNGKEWIVREFSATFGLEKGSVCFGRIGKVGDHYELIGADPLSLQKIDEATKKSFQQTKFKLTPKIVHEIWKRQ